ncbi:zf-HC2 domain-containing protein [Nakamurella sp. A5-74]|uniref:zf-HC2 domain-containing protein n=1 Tax=Nakamurella sp. A5-74 TaxID=3158264 RepID=UPI00336BF981
MLQSYLDGEVDDRTAAIVNSHLEFCRRCGLEASTHRAIKTVIASIGPGEVDAAAVSLLRAFVSDLEAPEDGRDRRAASRDTSVRNPNVRTHSPKRVRARQMSAPPRLGSATERIDPQ